MTIPWQACARPPAAPSDLKLPPGFGIEIYASEVPDARSLALGEKGTVFVGTRGAGKVYALVDSNQDGKVDRVLTLATGLNEPNGVAFQNGALYVAETRRILRYDAIEEHLDNPPKPTVLFEKLPAQDHHEWKFIAFGPDGKLYIPIGAPCNNCESSDPRFASLGRMNADGTGYEIFARGIRNTVGFDWQPQSHELWFTENGRDEMGDEVPPDELNRAPQAGLNFGFPYCHAGDIPDPDFGSKHRCAEFEAPVRKLGPHVAALGMRFYTGTMFPPEYRNQIFIAEHGSWNRSRKIGYRISLVTLRGNEATDYRPFAEGWLAANEKVWGRPVDLLILRDGSMLVSDDYAGAVYRIVYSGKS